MGTKSHPRNTTTTRAWNTHTDIISISSPRVIGHLQEVGRATHIPLKASDGEPFGGASAGDAHKVAAADVAGEQRCSNLWSDEGYYCYDVTKCVACFGKEKKSGVLT